LVALEPAVTFTAPELEHVLTDVPETDVGAGTTIIVSEFDEAVVEDKQVVPTIEISQVTTLPLLSAVLEYVFDTPLCLLIPPTLKSYVIVPPPVLVVVAVNVHELPEQIVAPGLAPMDTVGVVWGEVTLMLKGYPTLEQTGE
jgi:hypothetical protein